MGAAREHYVVFNPSRFKVGQDSLWACTRRYVEICHHDVDALLNEDFGVVIGYDFRFTHIPPRGGFVPDAPLLSDLSDPRTSPESDTSEYRPMTPPLPVEILQNGFGDQLVARLASEALST